MINDISNIILGTAQFGMDYGITNRKGRVAEKEATEILAYCKRFNIQTIDAAANYGKAEKILGRLAAKDHFAIYSKTLPLHVATITRQELESVETAFFRSLGNLKASHVEGVYVHHANDLLVKDSDKLYHLMLAWKQAGLTKKIGVSIYDQIQLQSIIANYDIDVIQLPLNIYDQRLLTSGALDELKKRNIEIHARSIFLQGLLLSEAEQLPSAFSSLIPRQRKLELFFNAHQLTKLEGALQFIVQIKQLDAMLVGVDSINHMKEIIHAFYNQKKIYIDFQVFQIDDVNIIDPRRW
ncbi:MULTISPECIES: aldo/keto reductase [Clostridia]|uniref:aldo/keto reductase n=1 Tax=Clostridia TaxID=186801 RepID=UPI0013145593|nr:MULTISPECIES: aldo/keto reductase [Clostridia]